MTIQEVIKSGLPFRRSGCTKWYGACEDKQGLYLDAYLRSGSERTHLAWSLKAGDLLATDWETKSEPLVFYRLYHPASGVSEFFKTKAEAERASYRNFGSYVTKLVEVVE